MRKGVERRAAILRAAEDLFYRKGYDATTIQNILDVLGLSKGGFYHHFQSKEQLLEEICAQKVESSYRAAEEAVALCPGNAIARLNAMYDKNGIWQEGSPDLIGLWIRVAYHPDNLRMRERIKALSRERSLPLFNKIVREGVEEGVFFTPYPDTIGTLLLQLGSNLTDDIAEVLVMGDGEPKDMAMILEKLELYRHAIEQLLNAPYGSICIFQIGRMADICDAIWRSRHAS